MATRLAQFAASVHARLVTAGITVPQRDDIEALQQHDIKVRIVWLTPGGQIEQPRQAGARAPSSGAAQLVTACKVRVERVEAHIFAGTREATEELLDAVIAAVCDIQTVCEMPGYSWPQEEEREKSGRTLRTHEAVLIVLLRLPVSAEISPLTPITAVDDICGTIQADGSIVPQDEVPP